MRWLVVIVSLDDPDHATFAMLSMKNAGLRIFDIRDPSAPKEVAYFNPGQYRAPVGSTLLDRARQHTHYDKAVKSGRFEYELHGSHQELGALEVRPE